MCGAIPWNNSVATSFLSVVCSCSPLILMQQPPSLPRVAVIGAGPIGLEMGINLVREGKFQVTIFEKGSDIASHIKNYWAHVNLFSSNALNMSKTGREIIVEREGPSSVPDEDEYCSGGKFVETYLRPLERYLKSSDKCDIRTNTAVVSVARKEAPKKKQVCNRALQPFRMLCCNSKNEEYYFEADFVIDASGSYSNPNYMGADGLPAIGERHLRNQNKISYFIPEPSKICSNNDSTSTTAVIGSGASAITTINAILESNELATERGEPSRNIIWVTRTPSGETPYNIIAEDPLPQRECLYALGNTIANEETTGIDCKKTVLYKGCRNIVKIEEVVSDIETSTSRIPKLHLTLQHSVTQDFESFDVDEVISNCGYRPDFDLTRELQVHYCYVSEGPMKLAAAMLAASGGSTGDCLAQVLPGKESLRSPEPRFFVIGMKSYGRGSSFLLRIGYEQVEGILSLIKDEIP